MIFSLDSFLRILRFLPLIESVLNRRFWYVICVNTLVWSIGFWLLTGGGEDGNRFYQLLHNQKYPR